MNTKFELDLTFIPKELKVLLELIQDKNDEYIQENKDEWFIDIDWDYFLKLAMHHRIYPLVYLKLKEVGSDLIPSQVLQTLQAHYQKNTFQMLHLSGEMERISELFTKNQVCSLFLKGPVVAYDLYDDISLRTSKDLDILIQKSDLENAEELLLKQGYTNTKETTTQNDKKGRNYHISYFHPYKKIEIELHWRLHPYPINQPTFEELWERKRNSNFTSYPVLFLGKEDLLLYLSVHGARHGWFRLRWLKDIDQMLKQQFNYKKVNSLQKKYQYSHMIGQTLMLVNYLLNTKAHKEIKLLSRRRSKKLAQLALLYIRKRAHSHINEFKNLNNYHTRYLFLLMPTSRKILFILTLFYPSSKDEQTLPLPSYLHFLYFPLRPFLWIWRKTVKLVQL
ncbi:nucleotidyltransferase domain-containing protein [Priestia megaterium]|uniref:nucleotidyltransferase domain-containing protein n=1 Tax=Priestia megaterium TaxID=1404 RepID=UPI00336B8A91